MVFVFSIGVALVFAPVTMFLLFIIIMIIIVILFQRLAIAVCFPGFNLLVFVCILLGLRFFGVTFCFGFRVLFVFCVLFLFCFFFRSFLSLSFHFPCFFIFFN